jgi:hypothetical protein
VVVNSGSDFSLLTLIFVYCLLHDTILLFRTVETFGEYRSNGFLISFERIVKAVC